MNWFTNLAELFVSFAKVGVSGFGGGQSLVPLIQDEVVQKKHWVTAEQFTDILAIGNGFPGPISTKLAIYIGYAQAGLLGSVFSIAGLIIPSGLAMLMLTGLLMQYRDSPRISGLLQAVRPAVIGMLVLMVFLLGRDCMVDSVSYIIAGITIILIGIFQFPPGVVIIGFALIGALWLR